MKTVGSPDNCMAGLVKSASLRKWVVLGIGGVKALRALGIATDVYHFNEGHALFASLNWSGKSLAAGMDHDAALAATRKKLYLLHIPLWCKAMRIPLADRLLYMGADNGST